MSDHPQQPQQHGSPGGSGANTAPSPGGIASVQQPSQQQQQQLQQGILSPSLPVLSTPLTLSSTMPPRMTSASGLASASGAGGGVAQEWGQPPAHSASASSLSSSTHSGPATSGSPVTIHGAMGGGGGGGGSGGSGGGADPGPSGVSSVPLGMGDSSARMDDLMSRLTTLSSAYQTGRGVGSTGMAASAPVGDPAAVSLVPHIVLDRIAERSSKSGGAARSVITGMKGSTGSSRSNKSSASSAEAGPGVPLRTPPTHTPLVAPVILPDSNNPAVASFNPLGARPMGPAVALSMAPSPPHTKAAAGGIGLHDNQLDDGNTSEVELAALGANRPHALGGIIGSNNNNKEQQQLLPGARNSSGGLGLLDGGREWEDDAGPDVFFCGVIPTKFRREFWAPLACVVLMLGIAGLVAALLYENLHAHELSSFKNTLDLSCKQRARLLVQNFGNAQAAAHAMAGFFAVQQDHFERFNVWWSNDYFNMYLKQSKAPTFIDRFVLAPAILDSDRARFERASGNNITDIACLGAANPEDITDNNPHRDQFDFSYLGRCRPQNLTFFHTRQQYPYYFPYTYHFPNFTTNTAQPVNLDAVILFPIQGVPLSTITYPIASGEMMFSGIQPPEAADVKATPEIKGHYSIVSVVPLFREGAVLSHTGNLTADFWLNLPKSQGLVASTMRTREALKQAIDSLDPVPLHVVLWDEGWQKPTVVPRHDFVTEYWPAGQPSAKQDPDFYDPSLNASVPLEYGNHNYRLDCIPTREMVSDSYSSTPTLIAAGAAVLVGVCMLMLICGWLILNVRRSNSRAALLIEANAGKNLALELLAEAKELADRANKSKSDFLAFLCHELRNPLHAISAMVEFLHNDYFRQAAPGRFTPSQPDELVPENNRRGGGGMATGSTGSQEGSNTSSPMMSAAPDGVLTMVPGGASNAVTPGGMIPPPPRSDRERRRRSNSGINVSSSMGGGGTAVSRRRRRVEAAECVTIINTQVTMMRSILDDFLDMSKIESGVLHFEKIGFELALLAKQCVQSLASKCKEKGIRIRLRLNQVGLPRKGYADPTRIKQLILNLLTNAIKFTHEGAVELFVEAIPMTHETALAAELPPEAFEWAFGDSVNLDGSSNAINNKNGGNGEQGADGNGGGATNVKGSKSQPLHTQTRTAARASVPGGTPSRGHSKAANTADEAKSASPLVVMVHRADGSAVPMEQKNNASSAAGGKGKGTGGRNTPNVERKEGDGVAGGSAVGAAGAGASDASHLAPPPPERPSKIILHISVTDSGSGIAPSALPHLFQPYSQEKLSIMRTHGGTGLGLAIVKNIVAHMHGSIHVTTQQGKGSKFSLHLPIDCRKPGSVAGSRAADADQLESDLNEAELQSTVMRLRRLHNDAAEEEEDVIESHLMDKFERSLHAGTGGMPSNGDSSGGINSSGDSDEGGRFARRPPPPLLSGAVNASHGPVVPRAMPMPSAASWLQGSSLRAAAMAAQQHREPSSSSSSLSGSLTGGSRSSGSVPRGPLFHDDVNITLHPLQQSSRTNSGPGTPGGSHIVGPSQAQLQVEGQPNGVGTPGSTNNNPGGAPHAIAASAAAAFPPQSSMAVDLLTASSSQELSSGGLLWPAGSSASAPASAEQRTRQLPPTPVLSLLLVDDADVNLKILCKMLGVSLAINGTKYKLSLTTACNGVDAMRRVEERRRTAHCGFHVILSDIVMPLADGFQFAQMLREFEQKEGARPVPLVALTANALKADVDAYTAASFRWFVPKPFRRADLMGVLTSVLHETMHSPDALAAATPRLSPLSGGDGAGAPATATAPGTNGSRLSSSGHSISAAMSSPAGISVNNAVREPPLLEDE